MKRSIPPVFLLLLCPAVAQPCTLLRDFNAGPGHSYPGGQTAAFGTTLYFAARSSVVGYEPFKWTRAGGLQLLKDMVPGTSGGGGRHFAACCTAGGPRVFFYGNDGKHGNELWSTDGTAAGTKLVRNIYPGALSSGVSGITALDGKVLFSATDGISGQELWISDGTAGGTKLLKDIEPGRSGSNPDALTRFGGRIVFTAYRKGTQRELWITDGTTAGTFLLKDVYPGTRASAIEQLTACGDKVFFAADDGVHGKELWVTDGTPNGTKLVKDIFPGTRTCLPRGLACCFGKLFFGAQPAVNGGSELWVSDGTAAGTFQFKEINKGYFGSNPDEILQAGGKMFLVAGDSTTGLELWVSDGTPAGTRLTRDIFVGRGGSAPRDLCAAGGGVYFNAQANTGGRELWFSDGTAAGTKLVCDLDTSTPYASGNPTNLVACDGALFFQASNPTVGIEMFTVQKAGASHYVVGQGSRPSRPTLGLENRADPVLGTNIKFVAKGPANHIGALTVGAPLLAPNPSPLLLPGGCDFVGFLTPASLFVAITTRQDFAYPLAVPNLAGLAGVALNLQMWWFDPAAAPQFQASNGLRCVLGRSGPG